MSKENLFSKKFDELFEKPKVSFFINRKYKSLFIIGLLLISSVLLLTVLIFPKQLHDMVTNFNSSIETYNRNMEELNESLDYTDTLVLKEKGLKLEHKPNYDNVKSYSPKMINGNIDFGNGYILKIKNNNYTIDKGSFNSLSIKAKEESMDKFHVASVDSLATYKFQITKYLDDYDQETKKTTYYTDTAYQTDSYISVYISDNLLDNLNVQVMKEKGAFYEVLPLTNVGQAQTGIIINSSINHSMFDNNENEIPSTYLTLYKYWIFPDGTGVYVQESKICYGRLTVDNDVNASVTSNLKEIDIFSQLYNGKQSLLTFIDSTFELQKK
ncbi:hypothetical protein [Enterococcus plantarum]|uniref:hypothetical protein n=1 Tax=Enterococcus plantarum TaxID=1077675 RepID=UPI001A8D0CAE|nr:hypothetical protein [Enterococcus plantarum]MBO0423088.1 hypothetical protein [Enterococcus plantarum]